MQTVNERTSIIITLQFVDVNKAPVTPGSVTYQITDDDSETILIPWQTFSPSGPSVDVAIDASAQQIVNECKEYEFRTVSVISVYNSGAQQSTGTFKYRVKNLRSVFQSEEVEGLSGGVGGGTAGF